MPNAPARLLFTGVFLVSAALSSSAEAVRVKNRDDVMHQLAVSSSSGDEQVIELQPGEIYNSYSPAMTLRLLDGEHPSTQRGRFLDEYVIWPDGRLLIQKHRWPGGTAFHF